jgi:hypothetical protein
MTGVSSTSLASWAREHGFGILCIINPLGEHFVVGPADEAQAATEMSERGFEAWTWMSESQVRQYLAEKGFSASDTEDAIVLARDWATTMSREPLAPARSGPS